MKHPFIIVAFGFILSLCSCASEEDKALETVKQFAEAVQSKDAELQKELFPQSVLGSCRDVTLNLEGATVKKDGETFIVSLPESRDFYLRNYDGKYVIEDSRNVIVESVKTDYDDSIDGMINQIVRSSYNSDGTKYGIAVKSGMIQGKGIDTDVSLLTKLNSLKGSSEFINFLSRKYPDALQGNTKTLSIKQKRIGRLFRVDVISESGGNMGGNVYATLYDKNGTRVARKFASLNPGAKGDRQSAMFLFDSDVVGNIGEIKVDYSIDNLSDADCLLYFAPISSSDYQEYLNSKK